MLYRKPKLHSILIRVSFYSVRIVWTTILSYPKSKPKTPHFTEVFLRIIPWLERMVVVQTLPEVEDEQELQQTIQEVRTLLDEVDECEPKLA